MSVEQLMISRRTQDECERDRQDLIGKVFGTYTIMGPWTIHGRYRRVWMQCSCGHRRQVSQQTISKIGAPRCTKCTLQGDLTGEHFHDVEVIGLAKRSNRGVTYWSCLCRCGNTLQATTGKLRNGHVKSCGCRRTRSGDENPNWIGCGEISGGYWSRVLLGAKSRGLLLDITIESAWDIFLSQNGKCALTGVDLEMKTQGRTASLDRIDSDIGYTFGNVQWVHKDINCLKSNYSESNFIRWCTLVARHHEGR